MALDAQTMADISQETQPCPLCGNRSYEVVGTRDRRGASLQTVLCAECGHVFTNPAPPLEHLRSYYKEHYRQDYKGLLIPKRKHIYRAGRSALERLARIEGRLAPGAHVIDVGAGGGEFVYLMKCRGFHAMGVEPNAGYATYARKEYEVDIRAGSLEEAEFPEERADLVTMHHVLEHARDPMGTLTRLRSWLKPGGLIAIEVPNLASWAHAPKHRFHKAHLHTFHREGLEDALANSGFEVIEPPRPKDRGHLYAVGRKAEIAESRRWRAGAAESRAILRSHTSLAHFLSGQPLRRIHASATRPIAEALAIRKLGNPPSGRALLNKLYVMGI